jgi:hypothetical protein
MAIGPQRKLAESKICELIESIRSIEASHIELTEIDENLSCGDPSAAEQAILEGKRSEIMQELAVQIGTLSLFATAFRQALRRAGEKPAPRCQRERPGQAGR